MNQNNAQDEKVLKIILFIIYERQYRTLLKLCKYVHKLTETLCPKIMQIYGNYFEVDSGYIRHSSGMNDFKFNYQFQTH